MTFCKVLAGFDPTRDECTWELMLKALLRWRVTSLINRPKQIRKGRGWTKSKIRPLWTRGTHERLSASTGSFVPSENYQRFITRKPPRPLINTRELSPREPLLAMVQQIAMRDPTRDSFHCPGPALRTKPLAGSLGRPRLLVVGQWEGRLNWFLLPCLVISG